MSGHGPFDPPPDGDGADAATHLVLRNHEGQLSLWPVFAPPPGGWEVLHGPAPYGECLEVTGRQHVRSASG